MTPAAAAPDETVSKPKPAPFNLPYIAWEIQQTCNMGCEFCYSSSYNRFKRSEARERPTLDEIRIGLSILSDAGLGISHINWSGGEPLLRHAELPEILEASKAMGFRNILSTNGMFSGVPGLGDPLDRATSEARFAEYAERGLFPNLDWLSVSLDSGDRVVNNDVMRLKPGGRSGSPHHYDDVRAILDLFRSRRPSTGLKVNTLITGKNIGPSIRQIGSLLRGLSVTWKLVQFNPRECPGEYRSRYRVEDAAYWTLVEGLRNEYGDAPGYENVRISTRHYDGQSEPYCFLVVNTSGMVLLPRGEEHVPLRRLYGGATAMPGEVFAEELARALEAEISTSPKLKSIGEAKGLSLREVFSRENGSILHGSYAMDSLAFDDFRLG